MKQNHPSPDSENLRQKAEKLLQKKHRKTAAGYTEADTLKVIHELEVHQLQLEMQNQELIRAKELAEVTADKYSRLYDFAPLGYFTLTTEGVILEINRSGSFMLGKERTKLVNSRFGFFVSDGSKPVFNQFMHNVFSSHRIETCELAILNNGNDLLYIHLSGIVAQKGDPCYVTATDISRRWQAETALQQSEEKYRLIVENSEIGIGIYSLEGIILYYNQKALEALGGVSGDYVGKSLAEIFGVPAAAVFVKRIQQAAKSERNIEYEEFVKLDPGDRWFLSIYSRIKDSSGKITGVQVIAHDITERKQAEEALRESNGFLESLINHANAPIVVWDSFSQIMRFNHALEKLTGRKEEDMLGQSLEILFPPELAEHSMALFNDTQASERGEVAEISIQHCDGSLRIVLWNSAAIYSSDGETLLATIAHGQDITERKQAEEKSRASTEFSNSLIASMHDGVVVLDKNGVHIDSNPALSRMTGFSPEELFGISTPFPYWPKEEYDPIHAAFQKTMAGEIENSELVFMRKNGERFPVIVSPFAIKDKLGNTLSYSATIKDISERKKAEHALHEINDRLSMTLEVGNAGVWTWDVKSNAVSFDERFHALLGYTSGELPVSAEDWLTYHHPDDVPAMMQKAERYLKGETPVYESEHRIRTKTGEWNWIFTRGKIIKNELNSAEEFLGIAMNVTARRQIENQLQRSLHNLAEAERIGNTGSWEYDVAADTATWSENMFRIFDIDPKLPKELVNRYFVKNLVHPDDHANAAAFFRDALAGKDPGNMEFRIIDSAEKTRYIHALAEVIRDADGNPVQMIGKVEDITERKLKDEALKESKIQLELAHRAAGAGTWDWDMISGKLTWSKELFALFGLDPEKDEATFDTWTQVVHPEDRSEASERIEIAIREKTQLNSEYRVVYTDGQVHWINSLGNTIYNKAGEPFRMTGICTDITERRQIENQLKRSLHNLAEAERIGNTGSWEYNVTTDTAVWSENMFRIFDVDPEMPKGLVFTYFLNNLVHPDDRANVAEVFRDALAGKRAYDLEYRILKSDKAFRYIHALAEIIRDTNGNPVQMIGKVEDITDRKQAEENSAKAKAFLAETERIGKIGGWEFDAKTMTQTWTDEIFRILEIDISKGAPKVPEGLDFFHPESKPMATQAVQRAIEFGEPYDQEWKIITTKGNTRWVHSVASVYQEQGKTITVSGSFQDITDRRQAEESQRETNAYLENLVNYANAPIIVWDPQFRITRFNHAFEALTGWLEAEVLGESLEILFPPSQVTKSMILIRKTLTGERFETVEIEIMHRDKSIRTLLWNSATLFAPNTQTAVATIAQGHDITERKHSDEALLTSEEQFRTLFENSIDSVAIHQVVFDERENPTDYIFLRANTAFEKQTGLKIADISGKRVTEVIPGVEKSNLIEIYGKVALTGEPVSFEQYFEPFSKYYHINAYQVGYGRFVTVFQDITKRKRDEEEIKQKNEALQALNAEKDKFFSIIAHDLRSPFNSLLGFTQIMVEDLAKLRLDEIQVIAQAMRTSATNLYNLLENLLVWSSTQSGKISFIPSYFLLKPHAEENLKSVYQSAKHKGIDLKIKIPDDLFVFADANMIGSTIRNFASNALKFTPKGGIISVEAKLVSGNQVEVSISDTGIGMNNTLRNKLFRLNENVSRKGLEGEPSTGLGLILCKDFIEKHGGKIWVESEVGKGSTFYFSIPFTPDPSEEKKFVSLDSAPKVAKQINNLKILIAEDDETSEMLISIALKLYSSEIYKAATGLAAVEICREYPEIDLIMMDIKMPVMDGYEATRLIREFNTKVVIIAQTAFEKTGDRQLALEAGCTEYISKPLNLSLLKGLILKHFGI